jgi:uncharacterized DUF497 family protein
MRYTWDDDKNRANLDRHGIAFEDAQRIFEGPTVEKVDDRFDYGEIRVYAIGLVNGVEITVIYADSENPGQENGNQENERRIISAWRAEPHERRAYWQSLEG